MINKAFEDLYEPKQHLEKVKFHPGWNGYDYLDDSPTGVEAWYSVSAAYKMWLNNVEEINRLKTTLAVYKEDMQKDAEKIAELESCVDSYKTQMHEIDKLTTAWRIKRKSAEQNHEINKAFYYGKCLRELEYVLRGES